MLYLFVHTTREVRGVKIAHYTKVARWEYLPAELPALLVPIFLTFTSIADIPIITYMEGVAVFALLYFSGFIINASTDIDVDKKCKTYVAYAAESMGIGTLRLLTLLQVIAAFLLSLHLAYITGNIYLPVLVAIGIFFGIGYSVKPFHFKVRGTLHVIALLLSAFMLPFIFLYSILTTNITPEMYMVIVGFSFAHYGIALTNQTADYLEDKEGGMCTPAVRWGLLPTIRFALIMMFAGLFVLLLGLGFWASSRAEVIGLEPKIAVLILACAVGLGYSVPIRGLYKMKLIAMGDDKIEDKMKKIKALMNYPRWQASGILGLVIATGSIFTLAILYPQVVPPTTLQEEVAIVVEKVVYDNGFATISFNVSERCDMVVIEAFWGGDLYARKEIYDVVGSVSACVKIKDENTTEIRILGYKKGAVVASEIVKSKHDIYIKGVSSKIYYKGIDKRANLTISLYNAYEFKSSGEVKVVVQSYSHKSCIDSVSIYADSMEPGNTYTIHADVDLPETGDCCVIVSLFKDNKLVESTEIV